MNKGLVVEYLFDVFSSLMDRGVHPRRYFEELFSSSEFIPMIQGKPFDIDRLKDVGAGMRPLRESVDSNRLRYLSFLTAELLETTSIAPLEIPHYLNPEALFEGFDYFHTQDPETVIYQMMIDHNAKYRIRKGRKEDYLNSSSLKRRFLRLFPFKKWEGMSPAFDAHLGQALYLGEDGIILFAATEIGELLQNDYFRQKYLIGNRAFAFFGKTGEPIPHINGSFTIFIVDDYGIFMREPNGLGHTFSFSK